MTSITSTSEKDKTGLENTPCKCKTQEDRTEQETETAQQVERTGQQRKELNRKTDKNIQFKTQKDRTEPGGEKGQDKTGLHQGI
jgi:hypothetical protein